MLPVWGTCHIFDSKKLITVVAEVCNIMIFAIMFMTAWCLVGGILLSFYNDIQHTHPFNGRFSATPGERYQKGKTNLDFTEARDSEWQWYQLGHMQVCTSLQTDNHTGTPPLFFYRPDALPATQPTTSKHWRQTYKYLMQIFGCFHLSYLICLKEYLSVWIAVI